MIIKNISLINVVTDRIDKTVMIITSGMLVFLICLVLTSVFFRYVLNNSLSWSEELARYICIWIGFLSASMALRRNMHIGLSYFIDSVIKAGPRLKQIIFIINFCDLARCNSGDVSN